MCILSPFALSLAIAVLSVVTVADSVPQLTDWLDQNNLGTTIAFNPDIPQNEIGYSGYLTNPTDPDGSSAGSKELTGSTENAQIPSLFSDNLATLITYDPNAPSNPNGSPNSFIPSSSDPTLLALEELIIPKEVIPPDTVPADIPSTEGGANTIPSGGDIILSPTKPNWMHMKPGDTIETNPDTAVEVPKDVDENDPVDCKDGKFSMCCWLGAPDVVNGYYGHRGMTNLGEVRRDCEKSTFQV
ncbi:hypothetical protein MMC07_001273 [Pseudocyphellaria aurata]|nr:hypothetical protein [Pseudocyphellaria aurata]